MGEFEDIKIAYSNWLDTIEMVDYFREIYPKSKVIEEVLDSGRIVHRTFSPFYNHNSKEPQLYILEYGFFDFGSGNKGNISNIIMNDSSSITERRIKKYLSRTAGITLSKILKEFPEEWKMLLWESSDHNFYMDREISKFSKLGLNHTELGDGSWVNSQTGNWEEPVEYYIREFNCFLDERFQADILHYMPSVKKAIENAKPNTPPANNQLYK